MKCSFLLATFLLCIATAFAQPSFKEIARVDGGSVSSLLMTPGTTLFATAGPDVYRSTDHGSTWVRAAQGLPQNNLLEHFYDLGALTLTHDTHGQEAFFITDRHNTPYRSINNGELWEVMKQPQNMQGSASRLASTLMNSLGIAVSSTQHTNENAGNQTMSLDVSALPSGVYWYQIKQNTSHIATGSFVVVR